MENRRDAERRCWRLIRRPSTHSSTLALRSWVGCVVGHNDAHRRAVLAKWRARRLNRERQRRFKTRLVETLVFEETIPVCGSSAERRRRKGNI